MTPPFVKGVSRATFSRGGGMGQGGKGNSGLEGGTCLVLTQEGSLVPVEDGFLQAPALDNNK